MRIWNSKILEKNRLLVLVCAGFVSAIASAQDLTTKVYELPEVVYVADAVTVSNDTLTYNVGRIATLADKNVEDLLAKLPGVEIDASGKIRYNDKPISHFYIEGIDLLGGGYTLATRHIRPEDLLSIQILENHQPVKVMKGFETSDRAAINIRLKKSRLARPIGYAQAGAGAFLEDNQKVAKETSPTANVETHLMKIDKNFQQLLHLASQYDSYNQTENGVTDVGSEVSLSSDIERNVFATELFSAPAFSKKRYMSNRDVEANYSMAKKTSDEQTFKLNASYTAFRNAFSQNVLSQLLGEGIPSNDEEMRGKIIEREENNAAIYHTQKAKVNFETEKNAESLYLKHISALHFIRQANDYFLATNYRGTTEEHLATPLFDYKNSTTFAILFGETRLKANVSMALTNRPKNEMWFGAAETVSQSSGSNDENRIVQTFDGTSFIIKGNTSYQYSFNSIFNVGASLNAKYSYDDIKNHLSASIFNLQLSPFLRWRFSRETLTIEFPIDWNLARFGKPDKTFNYNKLNPDIRISNSYKFNRLLFVEAVLRKSHSYGTIFDFFSAPFRKSYLQTTRMGNDEWTFRKTLSADLSLVYRNPLEGTNLTLGMSYRNQENSALNDYSIGEKEDMTFATKSRNTQEMADATILASKQFYDQQFSIKLKSDLGFTSRTYLRSSVPYNLNTIFSATSLQLEKTMLAKRLNVRMSGGLNLSRSDFSTKNSQTTSSGLSNKSWTMDGTLNFSPFKNLTAFISYNVQWNKRIEWEKNDYLEGGMKYSFSSKSGGRETNRHEFNLAVTNLLNQRTWSINEISLVDKRIYRFVLQPLSFNASYKFNF